jgi:ABC-type multidrug transport system permease subunit
LVIFMDRFGLVLRSIVFFLFPTPFLLSFAVSHGDDWTGYVAYAAIGVLALAAAVAGLIAIRRNAGP